MACRRRSLLLASLALVLRQCKRRQEENKKQRKRFWVRKIFTGERKERGEWGNLCHFLGLVPWLFLSKLSVLLLLF